MPAFAHILFAMGCSIFLNRVSKNEFTAKHALVFTVNNLFGPDLMGLFFEWTSPWYFAFHMSYAWLLMAVPLAVIWDVFLNRVQWTKWKPAVVPRGSKEGAKINFLQIWLLVSAGGLGHMFLDTLGHPSYIPYAGQNQFPWGTLWFGGDNWLSIVDIWGTGFFPCGNELVSQVSVAGYIFTFGICGAIMLGGLLLYAHKGPRQLEKLFVASLLVFMIPLAIAYAIPLDEASYAELLALDGFYAGRVDANGDPLYVGSAFYLTGGEADFGLMFFLLLWFFVPLLMLYYSYNELPSKKQAGIFLRKLLNPKGFFNRRTSHGHRTTKAPASDAGPSPPAKDASTAREAGSRESEEDSTPPAPSDEAS